MKWRILTKKIASKHFAASQELNSQWSGSSVSFSRTSTHQNPVSRNLSLFCLLRIIWHFRPDVSANARVAQKMNNLTFLKNRSLQVLRNDLSCIFPSVAYSQTNRSETVIVQSSCECEFQFLRWTLQWNEDPCGRLSQISIGDLVYLCLAHPGIPAAPPPLPPRLLGEAGAARVISLASLIVFPWSHCFALLIPGTVFSDLSLTSSSLRLI